MNSAPTTPAHGGQLRRLGDLFHIPPADILDFSANINPAGPPPQTLVALQASLAHPATLAEYPDLDHVALKLELARFTHTPPANLLVANGFVPLLEAALRSLHLRTCLLPIPSFVEYRRTLERAGVNVTPHPLSADSFFRYDIPLLLEQRHDAILLANPQNPSGVCHNPALLAELATAALQTGTYILLDEAFIDFIPGSSLTAAIGRFPNLIVFRSVTKFFGFPGLRIAYAAAHASLAATIESNLPPWPVTTLASIATIAAVRDEAYALNSRQENRDRRDLLQRGLESCALRVYPSAANFLLFQLPPEIDAVTFWRRLILDHHIALRLCDNYEELAGGHLRAAVRLPAENLRLIAAIEQTLHRLC
jgi:threonine-phosphate decarboxylase